MPISFPSGPTLNQTYTYSGRTWSWDGTTWTSVGSQAISGPTGPTGPAAVYYVQAAPPSSPVVGTIWTNNTDGRVYTWTGTEWFEPYDNYIGATGPSSVISVTSPLLNSGTSTSAVLSIDRTAENAINDTRYALLADNQLYPIDKPVFNGTTTRFLPTYNGATISVANPYKLLVFINGIAQSLNFTEYVWQSGLNKDGFVVDSEGYISFSEPIPEGATFDGRVLPGAATVTTPSQYPFSAADILLGA